MLQLKNNHLRSILILVFLIISVVTSYSQEDSTNGNKKGRTVKVIPDSCQMVQVVYYSCPLHPKVRSDKAGNCPQCGITLDKKKEAVYYSCPIHSDIEQNREGSCEKCGSDLEKRTKPQDMAK